MEQKIKRTRNRPRIYTDEERREHWRVYMMNTPWYCDVCNPGHNYKLAGKTCHINTKKHIRNERRIIA